MERMLEILQNGKQIFGHNRKEVISEATLDHLAAVKTHE